MAFNNRKPQKQGAHGVARVISKRGYCSRSQAEKLVREGHVILRGKPVRDPESPAYENDEILIDGSPVTASEFVYFAMNKPRGIVTTASDEKGRKTVMDLFREEFAKMYPGKAMPHIAPVGRLDAASEGLLLFTNDTAWADRVLTDATHIKIYRVQVKGKPTAAELSQMESGFSVPPRVFGESEEFMHAERAILHSEGEKNCWLEITLSEGKNREIRRMLAHLGYEVMRLMRIQFDNFSLNDLKPGEIHKIVPKIASH
ncbi:23S rRNA pseudouridine2605 synthase [Fibrobacter sp. UWT2]|uniref:pseudouridine synthase n=1 Tax=Fibrobacter sp. UWT2 TaxID=1896224 RepID=UPI00091F34EC|nr:pseudouridine synthase [Fibrobacter sp. UWT2]SHK96965.1 23S rRNA pseudouridine2605 synthase [Fibrobacter sp. UWT2]